MIYNLNYYFELIIFAANRMPTKPAMAVVKTTNNRPPTLAKVINPLA
jgi:hypothetical protein